MPSRRIEVFDHTHCPPILSPILMNTFLKYWAPVICYMTGIAYLSSLSSPEEQIGHLIPLVHDKVLHATEYGVLGILCYRAFFHAGGTLGEKHAFSFAVLVATLYGLSDEYHQAFVPLRQADPLDLFADFSGALLGIILWQTIGKCRAIREKKQE